MRFQCNSGSNERSKLPFNGTRTKTLRLVGLLACWLVGLLACWLEAESPTAAVNPYDERSRKLPL